MIDNPLHIMSDIQVKMLCIFNHEDSIKKPHTKDDCSKKYNKCLPVEFFTKDTRFVKDFSVLLKRTTARDW